jgi:hypothetical protein
LRWSHPGNFTIKKDKQFRDQDVAKRWLVRKDAEARCHVQPADEC